MNKKFKVGDKVRWNGKRTANFICFLKENEYFLKSHDTLIIESIERKYGGYLLTFKDSDFYFDEHWFEKVEEPNFKVGDYVSSKHFEGVKQIHSIATESNKTCTIGIEDKLYNPDVLTLVCGFKKGEEIEVSNSDIFCTKGIFETYRADLERPFVVIHNYGRERYLHSYQYARKIKPKYKPYLKFNTEWKGKKIKSKDFDRVLKIIGTHYSYDNRERLICGIDKEDNVFLLSNEEMFKKWAWIDGSICGEEIKNEN